jgi:hypothetical protein
MCKQCIAQTCFLSAGTLEIQAKRALRLHCLFWGSLSLPCPARVQTGLYLVMPRVHVAAAGLCQRARQARAPTQGPTQGPLQLAWKQQMGPSRVAPMAVASALTSFSTWLQQIGSRNRRHMTAQYRREVACLQLVIMWSLTAPPQASGLRPAAAISSSISDQPPVAAGLRYRTLLVCFRLLLRAVRRLQLGQFPPRPMTLTRGQFLAAPRAIPSCHPQQACLRAAAPMTTPSPLHNERSWRSLGLHQTALSAAWCSHMVAGATNVQGWRIALER